MPPSRSTDLLPAISVLILIAAGLVIIAIGPWRIGVGVVGASAVLGGLLRLILPRHRAGPLLVRSRLLDAGLLLLSGVMIMILAVIIPPA